MGITQELDNLWHATKSFNNEFEPLFNQFDTITNRIRTQLQ